MAYAIALGANAASPQQQQLAAYPPAASHAVAQGETRIPIGWVDFCARYPRDCADDGGPAREVQLTPQVWRLITQVNARVNAAIEPVTDFEHWGVAERWDYAEDGRGDCEDYALLKRRKLIEAGLPRQALLMTVVRDRKHDGHAVLTVRTDRGDFILDNQEERVLPWTATEYRFVKRQSQSHQMRWVSLEDVSAPTATASR